MPGPGPGILGILAQEGPSREVCLSAGLWARCEAGHLTLGKKDLQPPPSGFEQSIALEGETAIDPLGIRLVGLGQIKERPPEGSENILCLVPGSLHGDLSVGPPRSGDRIRPYGLGGEKKLQDLLVDRKIPRSWRPWVPVFRSHGKVVAVLPPWGGGPLAVDEGVNPTWEKDSWPLGFQVELLGNSHKS